MDRQLWDYNLRDNIIPSIVRKIREQGYEDYTIQGLLEENVIPYLQKLGLSDLIPKLQETLIEKDKKDLPDFTKESQRNEKFTETDLEDLYTKDQDRLYEINETSTNTGTKEIKKEEIEEKEDFKYSNDTKSSEKDNFKNEITGNGEYNTGKLNMEGLYQHMESQEQQTQKDSINIENPTNPNISGR